MKTHYQDLLIDFDPELADTIMEQVKDLEVNESESMKQADEKVEEENNKLKKVALIISGSTFGAAIVVTIIERMIKNALNKDKSNVPYDSIMTLMIGGVIAACCSFIAEFSFMTNVVAEVRPLSSAFVSHAALEIMSEGMESDKKNEKNE